MLHVYFMLFCLYAISNHLLIIAYYYYIIASRHVYDPNIQ